MFSQLPIPSHANLFFLPDRLGMFIKSLFVFAHLPSPQGALKHVFVCTLNLCLLAQRCFSSSWDLTALGETETRLPECQQCSSAFVCNFPHPSQRSKFSCSWYQQAGRNPTEVQSNICAAHKPTDKCKIVQWDWCGLNFAFNQQKQQKPSCIF